jgi:hypothetical protein
MTGKAFEFNASVFYKEGVESVFVEYWVNNEVHTTINMSLSSGNVNDGNYSRIILVPTDGKVITYFITAVSYQSQIASTSIKQLTILDTIPPSIVDHSETPTTGDNFSIILKIEDNIEIENSNLTYSIDHGDSTLLDQNIINVEIQIPLEAHALNYSIIATDTSGNMATLNITKNVIDNKLPQIDPPYQKPLTSENYSFKCNVTDNWDVSNVTIEYWFYGPKMSGEMVLNGTAYEIFIAIPFNATILHYEVKAIDGANNTNHLNNSLKILDEEVPLINDITSSWPVAGQDFTIRATVMDNIALKSVYLEYWYGKERKKIDLILIDNVYTGRISVPEDAEYLHYIIMAEDTSENKASLPEMTLEVKTTSFTLDTIYWGIFPIIIIAIAIILLTLKFRAVKKKKILKRDEKMDEIDNQEE